MSHSIHFSSRPLSPTNAPQEIGLPDLESSLLKKMEPREKSHPVLHCGKRILQILGGAGLITGSVLAFSAIFITELALKFAICAVIMVGTIGLGEPIVKAIGEEKWLSHVFFDMTRSLCSQGAHMINNSR